MKHLSIDIETFSSVDIKKSGLYRYAQSPDFSILLFAFCYNGGEVHIIDLAQGEMLPDIVVQDLADPNVIKHAYNAAFEWYCINRFYHTPLESWRCTQLHGLYCGYPLGLGNINAALGLPADKRKMGVGLSLIRLFCCPTKPTAKNGQRTRTLPHHEPEKWELFKTYCRQDVVAEMEVERRLAAFPVPDEEQAYWCLDQRINAGGVGVDLGLVAGALAVDAQVTGELMAEAQALTGLDNPKSVAQLSKWLVDETGAEVDNLRKGTVADMLQGMDEGKAKRMLEIRLELSKTSVKKYVAMETAVCGDSRIRGLMQFYGANRTGRWAGRLVQVQNLPRNHMDTLDLARQLIKAGKVDALKLIYGNVPDTLSQLIRTAFVPREGHVFHVADYSAIEARVIAWLAGETWRQEVFATHGKIYEASASQMFGVPIEKIKKGNPEYDLRQKGKVAELALGYQGGPGALISMGALNMGLTEDELPEIVHRWRGTNKRICDMWYAMENAAFNTLQTGQPTGTHVIILAREADASTDVYFLSMRLPSGRKLYYVK
ncbi:MAG: DNA polymerase, partial [Negativicutes bacterium]|nr:DNA polymerase [Negativicutes bacterium]